MELLWFGCTVCLLTLNSVKEHLFLKFLTSPFGDYSPPDPNEILNHPIAFIPKMHKL